MNDNILIQILVTDFKRRGEEENWRAVPFAGFARRVRIARASAGRGSGS